ncbi:endonuclease, partial [Actinomyces sp. 565]|nr:endonuclease [Actinomyces sp. 565]
VRRIDHFLSDPLVGAPPPTAGEAAVPEAGAPGGSLPAGPRLRAVGGGTRAFVVSDHAGTWIDLEPVD